MVETAETLVVMLAVLLAQLAEPVSQLVVPMQELLVAQAEQSWLRVFKRVPQETNLRPMVGRAELAELVEPELGLPVVQVGLEELYLMHFQLEDGKTIYSEVQPY
jgi:hypothetical protein